MITIKTKDICEALNIKRHQLRLWTDVLEPYCNQNTKERSARKYDTGDLLFFAMIQYVERKFGVSISVLSKTSQSLSDLIRTPRIMNDREVIFLDMDNKRCLMADAVEKDVEGIFIDSTSAKNLVCDFLGVIPTQSQLHLGLAKVS